MQPFQSDVEAADAIASSYQKLHNEISKVIIGQDETVRLLLTSIFFLLCGARGLFTSSRSCTLSPVGPSKRREPHRKRRRRQPPMALQRRMKRGLLLWAILPRTPKSLQPRRPRLLHRLKID